MAADRFIHFKGESKGPTQAELQSVLQNFVGGPATADVEWNQKQSRFYITFPGKTSFPFADLTDAFNPGNERTERWIEVWMDEKEGTIDVMTRQMDEFTNVIADGLAKMLARYWQGELDG